MEELREFIEEAEVEENLLTTAPISEINIQTMSQEQLKDFVMEAVIETKLLEPIVIPIREAQLVQMSKFVEKVSIYTGLLQELLMDLFFNGFFLHREGLKELIMETPELIEKVTLDD